MPRRLIAPLLLGAVAATAPAVDFPPPAKLPSSPELPDPLTTFAGFVAPHGLPDGDEQLRVRRRPGTPAVASPLAPPAVGEQADYPERSRDGNDTWASPEFVESESRV